LQGWPANADGTFPNSGPLGPINISNLGGKGQATANMSIAANLDAGAAAYSGTVQYAAGDLANGTIAPTYSTTMNVYDSQGGSHQVKISYLKTAANTWQYEVSYAGDAGDINNNNSTAPSLLKSGTMTFNSDGSLADIGGDPNNPTGTLDFTIPWTPASGHQDPNNPNGQAISFDMGTVGKTDGMSQTASESVVNNTTVDGALFGNVTGVTIAADGTVYANFSNGLTQAEYKIPLATFANPNGLAQVGGNAFAVTQDSGAAIINDAGVGNRGGLQSYALEGSTVDLATEFTNMITTQQAYSASARVVSTASQMLDELMQMQH
jgi:flagellar hook protein FlgE